MTRWFEDVEVGAGLEPWEVVPTVEGALDFLGDRTEVNPLNSDEDAARGIGAPGVIVLGTQKMAWMAQYLDHWAGEGGRVATMRLALRRMDVTGAPLTFTGRVTDTRVEGDEHVVEIDVVILSQEGPPSTQGFARVVLPSRG